MATPNTNVTAGDFLSITRKYSNKDKEGRIFDVSADVNIANGKVTAFQNGSFTKTDDPSKGSGNFTKSENWLSFNANNLADAEMSLAFNSVMEFTKDVAESVKSMPEEE